MKWKKCKARDIERFIHLPNMVIILVHLQIRSVLLFSFYGLGFENRNQFYRSEDGARLSRVETEVVQFDYVASCLLFSLNCENKLKCFRLENRSNILLKVMAKQYYEEM